MIRYELETPMRTELARRRNLDPLTSRLLIAIDEESDILSMLSEYIYRSRVELKQLLAQTIICYDSVKKVRHILDDAGIRYWFDCDLIPSMRKPHNVVIGCRNQNDVLFILSMVKAEALAFYSVPIIEGQPQVNEAIVACSTDGYQEHNFLRHLDSVDYLLFYQSTHASIEVLGGRDAILGYFRSVCQ